MPGKDGRGPVGQGHGRGGLGQRGREFGMPGKCVCPNCGHLQTHQRALPCNSIKCSKCGTFMVRED